MYPIELVYFAVCTIIIILSSFLPTNLLLLLDNIIVRIAFIALLIHTMQVGPTAGIIVFMTIAILYLERNRRKVSNALKKLDDMEVPKYATVEEAYKKTAPVDVPAFDVATPEEIEFLPHDTHVLDSFEPVDVSINQKAVLSTIYPLAERTDELYEKMGFGHVDTVETVM